MNVKNKSMKKTLFWTLIFTLIGAAIPICYNLCTAEHKELTIQEEREIDFLNKSNGSLNLICNDGTKLDNHNYIVEYSITNTGNATIVGFGPNSDLLTADNKLRIALDSTIVALYDNDRSVTLNENYICFKQIRPQEKISLICIANKKSEKSLIQISDRDIKDADIVYTKHSDKLTTFEKTTPINRWIAVIGFIFNLAIILYIIIVEFWKYIKDKVVAVIWLLLWIIGLLYTMSLPLRWLL